MDAKFEDIVGKTLSDVYEDTDSIRFTFSDGSEYLMYHEQDCCESVSIESIDGNLERLVGQTILDAREETNFGNHPGGYAESWTFYIIRTNLDSITIRWLGESNGYYSEDVSFRKIN